MNKNELLFIQSIKQNNIDLIKKMIKSKEINSLVLEGFAFRFSAENGFLELFNYISKLEEYKNFKISKHTFKNVILTDSYEILKFLIEKECLLPECFDYQLIDKIYHSSSDERVMFLLFEIPIIHKELKINNKELYDKIHKDFLQYKIKEF
jgi:hypothetical protein